jgi:hypothetical protein
LDLRVSNPLKRYPLASFFVLAYGIAWAGMALLAAGEGSLSSIGTFGPAIAALVVTAADESKAGVQARGYPALLVARRRQVVSHRVARARDPGAIGHPAFPAIIRDLYLSLPALGVLVIIVLALSGPRALARRQFGYDMAP